MKCSLYISKGADKDNLINNQEFVWLVIISSIHTTFTFIKKKKKTFTFNVIVVALKAGREINFFF